MTPSRWVAAGLLLFLCGVARAQEATEVRGQVVDETGKPVAGAEVATFWAAGIDAGKLKAFNGVTTDAEGKFSLKAQLYGRPGALFAVAKDQKTGAIEQVDPKAADKPVTLKLQPLVEVHGSFTCKELNRTPKWTNVYIMVPDKGGPRVLQCMSTEAKFSFRLPPGTYHFYGYGTDIQNHRQDLTVTADLKGLDLGTIDVPAEVIARYVGKAPPAWNVTDARGLRPEVKLEDLKGKWVLVEFWGFW